MVCPGKSIFKRVPRDRALGQVRDLLWSCPSCQGLLDSVILSPSAVRREWEQSPRESKPGLLWRSPEMSDTKALPSQSSWERSNAQTQQPPRQPWSQRCKTELNACHSQTTFPQASFIYRQMTGLSSPCLGRARKGNEICNVDFPGGLLVKTLCIHCREREFNPWWGN